MSQSAINAVWLGGLVLQAALAVVLLARKMSRKFWWFTIYFLANLVMGGVLYVVRTTHPTGVLYFYSYWAGQGISLILGLGVVFEIFGILFAPYPALKKLGTLVFQWTVLVLLALGAAVIYSQPSIEINRQMMAYLLVEEAFRIVQVGLVAFLFLFANVFGLHWRQHAFGVALGVGSYAAMQLVALALRNYFGTIANNVASLLTVLDFDVSLLIWLGYLLAPELAGSRIEVPHREQLEQWNKALTELIYQ